MTEPDAERPWERPGVVRRDCEPHRGNWLVLLAGLALALAVGSFCFVPLTLVSVPLASAVERMAEYDLRCMGDGLLDPHGREETERAGRLGMAAVICCVLCWIMCLPFNVIFWINLFSHHP